MVLNLDGFEAHFGLCLGLPRVQISLEIRFEQPNTSVGDTGSNAQVTRASS
jgi:hypothetical protein